MVEQRTILIVEDHPEAMEMFSEMLKVKGFQVISCANGQIAIDTLRTTCPDAVILDLMMPEVPGLAVLSYMREHSELKDIPVIIVSAKGLPTDIKQGLDAGAAAYLTKPVSFNDLMKTLLSAFEEN